MRLLLVSVFCVWFTLPAFGQLSYLWQQQSGMVSCTSELTLFRQVEAITPSGIHQPVDGCWFTKRQDIGAALPPRVKTTDTLRITYQRFRKRSDNGLAYLLLEVRTLGYDT